MASLAATLLDLLFPPVCLGCAGPIAPGDQARLVCRRCRSRLRSLPGPGCPRCGAPRLRTGRLHGPVCGECEGWPVAIRSARSACLLHHPADRLVHQLKYHGWHALAGPMASRMAETPLPHDVREESDLVVHVPTTRRRRQERGYDQARLLARQLARCTGRRPIDALQRVAATGTQTALQPAARRANVAGAFRVTKDAEPLIRGAHPLLIDDVLTTGATAAECATTLVEAGARCVSVLTFARALDGRRLTSN